MIYYTLIFALGLQRLYELVLGRRNWNQIKDRVIIQGSNLEKKVMIISHTLWFLGCVVEYAYRRAEVSALFFTVGLMILIALQGIRFWTIQALGEAWVPFPMVYRGQIRLRHGLYRYIQHPNYWVVLIEIVLVPLMGGAWLTAFIFGVFQFVFLMRRMRFESEILAKIPEEGLL